ncbi:MAG: ImmA/IrrE family metallo-endopeptidase [Oscillospiraceae bacterium]|nr:ImmA/IrrE family metallo-endopeptidase [Oscillospiraceae bacterium]
MLRLSRNDIEDIAESVLRDYTKQSAGKSIPIDIDGFTRQHLGLQVQYRRLSDDGSVLGLTAYRDVQVKLTYTDRIVTVSVSEDSILIDDTLHRERRGRFTIAHECAHQLLACSEERRTGTSFRKAFKPGKVYSPCELKSARDWSEWQANALGAALLMPKFELLQILHREFWMPKFTMYGTRFNSWDYEAVKDLADRFEVSITSMSLRLKGLGFIDLKPESEYRDPLDIFCDGEGA